MDLEARIKKINDLDKKMKTHSDTLNYLFDTQKKIMETQKEIQNNQWLMQEKYKQDLTDLHRKVVALKDYVLKKESDEQLNKILKM